MKLNLDKKVYEFIYSYASHLNNLILKKSNEDTDLSFEEHYVFQISSYLLTIINEQLYCSTTSLTTFFIYRCLIENIAIIKMFEAGDIDDTCFDLLMDYNYVIEYNMYKKYEQLDGRLFYFAQIKENYERVIVKYKDTIEYRNNKELREILRSRLPWLKNDYSFDELIKMYCDELYVYYKYLSITIHPVDPYTIMPILENEKFENLFIYIADSFVKFSSKYIKDETELSESINKDYHLIFTGDYKTNPNHLYMSYLFSQGNLLKEISDCIKDKFNESSNSDYLLIYKDILESIGIDKTFGYTEVIKCKMKSFLELVVGNNYHLEATHSIKGDKFFGLHSLYSYYRSINDTKNCESIIDSLSKDCSNLSKEEIENRMNKTLGFLKENKSVTQFINEYIEQLETIGFDYIPSDKDCSNQVSFKEYVKLIYDEANALSHANGYMIAANTGAFNDYFYPIILIDICIINILIKLFAVIDVEAKTNNINLNKLKYDIEKKVKQYQKIMNLKYQLDIGMNPFKISKI